MASCERAQRGKNENEEEKRELVYKEDGQEYGQVIRMLGNGRLEAQCIDGKKRLCHIRGKMRKKVWVAQVRKHGGRAQGARDAGWIAGAGSGHAAGISARCPA